MHVTDPEPVPAVVTVSELVGGTVLNVAVTDVFAISVTSHVPVPEHPPPVQPAKVDPADAEAVSVTMVPPEKFAEQVAPQLIPTGLEVTVPDPVPFFVTLSWAVTGSVLKVAVIAVFSHRSTVQSAMPLHPPPLHPAKLDPACGVPESVTLVPQG